MIRKYFLLAFLAITTALCAAHAAETAGMWKVLPMSGPTFNQVLATPSTVYYVTGNSLYSYDIKTTETEYYTPGSRLSDSQVKFLRYNPDGKYVLAVYSNNNIDLVYDNGRIVNLPEIHNASITAEKTINSVTFGKGRIYVATAFGIVVYDDKNHVVIESGIYDTPVDFAGEFGDRLVILTGGKLMESPKADRHNSLAKFRALGALTASYWMPVSTSSFLGISGNNIQKVALDFAENAQNPLTVTTVATVAGAERFDLCRDGFFTSGTSEIAFFTPDGELASKSKLPKDFGTKTKGLWTGLASVWAGDSQGLGQYDITTETPTVLTQPSVYNSSRQFAPVYHSMSPDGSELYFSQVGETLFYPFGTGYNWAYHVPLFTESYNWSTGEITPRWPVITKQYSSYSQLEEDKTGYNTLWGGPGAIAVDPVDPSMLYVCNTSDGFFVIKDRKVYDHYDNTNCPMKTENWCKSTRVYGVSFDTEGNLWVAFWPRESAIKVPMLMVPKESLALMRQTPGALSEKDSSGNYRHWLVPKWVTRSDAKGWAECQMVVNDKYGVYIFSDFGIEISVIDRKGTTTLDDDVAYSYNGLEDQDGNQLPAYTKGVLTEDKNGRIWLGTSQGVFVINPKDLFDNSSGRLKVTRPKVARNDGTVYADYLLESDWITGIAVDPSNRKWIATLGSGLFLVNEDGTEIIRVFNKDNSPLLSNQVSMVACNPNGNEVFIGTPGGNFVYSSDSAPAHEDFSDIYAYPNPVRPDYTGWITVKGLMDNSLVKIADQQGNVVWNGCSEGGMVSWDGCDASGRRVHSGVYLVFASSSSESTGSGGAVTKIVVIN